MGAFIAILLIIILCMAEKLYMYSKTKDIQEAVAWCVSKRDHTIKTRLRIRDCFEREQIEKNIQADLQIVEEKEWDYARDIIHEFQSDLIDDFFDGTLKEIRKAHSNRFQNYMYLSYHTECIDYFMFYLSTFLQHHENDLDFRGNSMYEKSTYKDKRFGTEYILTEYAIVYHKMYYIAYNHCIEKGFSGFFREESDRIKSSAISKTMLFTR